MLQVRPPSRPLAVMSGPRSIFSRWSQRRDNNNNDNHHNNNNYNGSRDQDNYSHSQSNYYAGDGASSAFSVAGALAAVNQATTNNDLNSNNNNDNAVIRIPPFQVPINQRLSPRADRWLYLFFSSCAAAASASLATPSSSSGGGFGGRSTGGGRSPAEQLALGMCGLSCVAACVLAAGFRYRPLRRWLTGSGCCHAKGGGKDVGGGGGCLCLRTGFTPEFQCAVVQLLLWTVSSAILWDPRHSLATASTLGSISIVWNANLFFSTYLSFGLACLLFAELCTVRNVDVLGLLAAVEAEHQRGSDKKNSAAAHAKMNLNRNLNLNDMLVRQTHQQMLGVVPFHHRYPTHQKIDMAFLLLAMASLALLGLGLDQMLGPLCRSPSDPTTQRACNDSTLSLIFGVLGLLLGTTHHLLSLSSRVQIRKFARGGCALRDVEPLLRANERRRNGLGAVFSVMTLLCFSLLVGFATGHRENDQDGSGNGNETGRAGNLYFLSWICFGLSLYLCVKHLEVFTVPSSSYGRVVGADDVAWVQDAEYYGFYDPDGMRRLSKAKIAGAANSGVANSGAKPGDGGSGDATTDSKKRLLAKSSSADSVETASDFSEDEAQDSDSPILYLPHTFDDSSSLGETYFDTTWYSQQQQQQTQAPQDPQQQMPMPEYYGHGSPSQGREPPMRQPPPRPEPPQVSPREPAAAAPYDDDDDDMPFMYEIDQDRMPIPQQPPTAFRRDTSERLSLFNTRNNSNIRPDPGRARERDTSSSSASPPSTQSGGSGIERVPRPFSDSSSSGRKKNLRDVDGFKMTNNKSRHFTELGEDSLAEIFSEESSGPYSNDHPPRPPAHRQPPAAPSSHGNSRGQSTGYASTVSGSNSSRGTRDRSATPSKSTSSPSRSSSGGKRRQRSAAKLHRSEGSIHQHPDDRHRNRSKASNSSSAARRNRRATMESGMSGGPPTLSADEDSYREGQGPPTVSASGGGEYDDDEEGVESVTQYVINGRPVRMNLNGSLDSMSMLSDPTVDEDPRYQQHAQQYNRPPSQRGHSTSSRRSPHSSSSGEENEAAAGMVDKLVMEALKQAHVARSNNIQRAERSRSGSRGGNSRGKSRSGSGGGEGGGSASRGGSKDKTRADSRQHSNRRSSTSKKSGSLHSFYSYGEMSSGTPMTNEGDDEAFAC